MRLYHENGGEDAGVQATTVELICEHADISIRTFFRYFDSKLDVIYLDYRQALKELEEIFVERLQSEPPPKALISASLAHVSTFVSDEVNRDRFLRAMKSAHFSERGAVGRMRTDERLSELIEGRLKPQPHGALRARAIVATYRGVFDQALALWVEQPNEPLPELVRIGLATIEATFASTE